MDTETFDFVICTMHTADKKDLHSGNFFANKTIEEAYRQYYEELLYCVTHFKHYSVLGHLDLVKRYTTEQRDRKSTRLNSSHVAISYAVFCLKKKNE